LNLYGNPPLAGEQCESGNSHQCTWINIRRTSPSVSAAK
jgi:hypothetical protein